MQATINISLDVPQTYQLETLRQELTEYAKKLVAKARPKAKEKKRYAFEALCGITQSDGPDEPDKVKIERYLKNKYDM